MAKQGNVVKLGDARASSRTRRRATGSAVLAKPGGLEALGLGWLEERAPETEAPRYRARLADGRVVTVALHPSVEPDLADECCESGQAVLLSPASAEGELVVVGALQVRRALAPTTDGELELSARRVKLEADETLELRVGEALLRIDKSGGLKVVGQRMTMDVGAALRVLASLVELP